MLRERIIKQAGTKFKRYGVKRVSMDDLASSLGISKRTLYENFRDKEHILDSFFERFKEDRNREFQLFVDESSNIMEVVLKIIEYHSNSELPSVRFYEDIYKYYPNVYEKFFDDVELNKFYFRKFLTEGVEQGFVRKNINIDMIAFLVEHHNFFLMRASFLKEPYMDNSPFSFKELIYTMMINFLRGISTTKGIEIIDRYLEEKE